MAFDTAGNLYAANYVNNTISKITPAGVVSTFASTGLNGPEGLAFDAVGNLYAVNNGNNTIERFTPGGTPSTFATGLSGPAFLAFGRPSLVVPEPNTWALVAVSVAGLGLSLRQRRFRRDV